jgi:carbon monoxide dehydrogenase subunit G
MENFLSLSAIITLSVAPAPIQALNPIFSGKNSFKNMKLEGRQTLRAGREKVWEFISDPAKFGNCLPELQSLEVSDDKNFKVVVRVGMLFIRGKLRFDFVVKERSAPSHTSFSGDGRGAGVSIKLVVNVDMNEEGPDLTELSWTADAELGGLLSEVSQSLLQSNTTKFTKQFFDCVKARVEA